MSPDLQYIAKSPEELSEIKIRKDRKLSNTLSNAAHSLENYLNNEMSVENKKQVKKLWRYISGIHKDVYSDCNMSFDKYDEKAKEFSVIAERQEPLFVRKTCSDFMRFLEKICNNEKVDNNLLKNYVGLIKAMSEMYK